MIHTLTLNPSLDATFVADRIELGSAQRLQDPTQYAGGKGMNVSVALRELGLASLAWVWVGGEQGARWKRLAQRLQVPLEIIPVRGESRRNIKIFEREGSRTTDLNLPGPVFDPRAGGTLLNRFSSRLQAGDYVVLAGSAPPNTPKGWWKKFAETVRTTRSHLIVDTSGEALEGLSDERPWAIKINRAEYSGLRKTEFDSLDSIVEDLEDSPPLETHVLVTDGVQGAVGCPADGKPIRIRGVETKVKGTVGAGDAVTAGFLAGWIEGKDDWEFALRMGVAAGTCAVELPGTSFGSRERVLEKLERF